MKRRVAVLGSTGSIGTQALDVLSRLQDDFEVTALAAGGRGEVLERQVAAFHPQYVYLADEAQAINAPRVTRLHGPDALEQMACLPEVDDCLVAVSGAIGLRASLAAARAGKRLLLANKESLVCGGQLLLSAVKQGGGL
nr:1-deoxy-D-xylulose-5-phosphate reductoisomerase [bacterium]